MILPVEQILPELAEKLASSGCAVLCAEPGAGKTTLVPPYLHTHLCKGKILMLEPRRIAARTSAKRIAELLHSPVGKTAGYRTRFETKVSSGTRIEILTEGILSRMIRQDPMLEGVELVIFDEFHERSLQSDLALALCMEIRSALREDLKILVMSATLDAEKISKLLGGAPVLRSPGKMYPVETVYAPRHDERSPIEKDAASAVQRLLPATEGDVLVFLPGEGEIRRVQKLLEDLEDISVLPLFGNLPAEEQNKVLEADPEEKRKVILSTSIAETSLTIDGVRLVIDCGLSRVPKYSRRNGMNRLETVRVSRASADQRRGRAGRTAPGVCCRMWSKEEDARLVPFNTPEILESDLSTLVLELASWGTRWRDIRKLVWTDPPEGSALEESFSLLKDLSALDKEGRITPHGEKMLALPLHPRLAHTVLESKEKSFGHTAVLLASLLSERDILKHEESADLTLRLACLAGEGSGCADRNTLARVRESVRQIARIAGTGREEFSPDKAGIALAFAYPDRIARQRTPHGTEYVLSNGTGARLRTGDPLTNDEFLALGSVEGERDRQIVFSALPVTLSDLEKYLPSLFSEGVFSSWDPVKKCVCVRRERRLGKIILSSRDASAAIPPETLAAGLLEGIRKEGISVLPFDEGALFFRTKVNFLRFSLGEEWPDLSDEGLLASLEKWLLPFISDGKTTKLEHLKKVPLFSALELLLTQEQRRILPKLAPERIEVPSGSKIRILYDTPDHVPLLRVRLQEIFGMLDTPKIAGGKVPVAIEILSPAMRCVQRTSDLRNFWKESYFLVRKDMRGRYPKHNWPEDPLSATASRRTTQK